MKPNDELALKILRFVSSTLLVVLSVVCANAQSRQTILQCNYMIAGVSPDTQISACNQLLSSKMRLSAQDLAGLHVMLGQGYYRKNDATKALIEFDEALKSKPSRPATTLGLGLRGVVHKSRGELDLALKDFNEALNLDPRNAPTMADRGSAYMEKRDYKRAMTDFDMALQLNPKMALTHLMRSNLYTIEGDDERADSDLKLAISLDPKRREDFIGRSELLRQWVSYLKEIQDYDDYQNWSGSPLDMLRGKVASSGGEPERSSDESCALAAIHWQSAVSIGTPEAYEDHLERFSTCAFAGLARAQLAKQRKNMQSMKP